MESQIRKLLFSKEVADVELGLILLQGQRLQDTMRTELYLVVLFGPTPGVKAMAADMVGPFAARLMEDFLRRDRTFGTVDFDAVGVLKDHPEVNLESLMEFAQHYHPKSSSHRYFLHHANQEQLLTWTNHHATVNMEALGLYEVPGGLRGMGHVQKLILRKNPLRVLPEWMDTLTGLQVLSLEQTLVRVLPDALGVLNQLQEINLSHSPVMEIGGIAAAPNLLSLQLAFCQELHPSALGSLPSSVKVLDIRGMHTIKSLENINGHQNLEVIRVSSIPAEDADRLDALTATLPSLKELLF